MHLSDRDRKWGAIGFLGSRRVGAGLPECSGTVFLHEPWPLFCPLFCEYEAYKVPGVAAPGAAVAASSQTVALLCPSAHAQRPELSIAWGNKAYDQLTWDVKDSVALSAASFLFPFRNATAAPCYFVCLFCFLFSFYLSFFLFEINF